MFVFPHITTNWIIQAIRIAGEMITVTAMLCAPVFFVYGIVKLVKERQNRDYLLICIINFVSMVLTVIGWFFVQ
jgi:hypothetical protein